MSPGTKSTYCFNRSTEVVHHEGLAMKKGNPMAELAGFPEPFDSEI